MQYFIAKKFATLTAKVLLPTHYAHYQPHSGISSINVSLTYPSRNLQEVVIFYIDNGTTIFSYIIQGRPGRSHFSLSNFCFVSIFQHFSLLFLVSLFFLVSRLAISLKLRFLMGSKEPSPILRIL